MKYSFTFSTIDAYTSAKGSNGAIKNVLATATSGTYNGRANSDGYLSRTCVSTITSTGQTFVDSVNIIVPREQGGEIGDTLLYNSNEQTYSWLKGRQSLSGTTSSIGSNCYVRSEIVAAGYKIIGFVGHREGNKCLIFGDLDDSGYPLQPNSTKRIGTKQWDNWSNDATRGIYVGNTISVAAGGGSPSPEMESTGNIVMKTAKRGASTTSFWASSAGLELNERLYEKASSVGTYSYPLKRSVWNTVSELLIKKGSTSGEVGTTGSGGAYNITNGVGQYDGNNHAPLKISLRGSEAYVKPDEWDYDFDLWYRCIVLPKIPVQSGPMAILSGRRNTATMVSFDKASRQSPIVLDGITSYSGGWIVTPGQTQLEYPAAMYCNSHGFSGIGEFSAGKWWMPSLAEMCYLAKYDKRLRAKGVRVAADAFWSSTQYSATSAWRVLFNGGTVYGDSNKSSGTYVFPVSAFEI